jgi:hypothetical protein
MKIKLALTILTICSLTIVRGQVNSLAKKFFLDLPVHAQTFDIRTNLQSNDNFLDVKDYGDSFYADFNYHPYIINLFKTKMKPHLSVQFNEKGLSNIKTITIYYDVNQLAECIERYNEIVKLFKPYTKKSTPSTITDGPGGEKTGTGLNIYPISGANFFLLQVNYTYSKNAQRYDLQILLFEDNIWK